MILPCPAKDTSCVAADKSNVIRTVLVESDDDCGCKIGSNKISNNFICCPSVNFFEIFSAFCHKFFLCSYWQSSHHSYEDTIPSRVFNCSLLSSCHPASSSEAYPLVTNSGNRFCMPDPFKRRKCLPGCRRHAPYCHGRCVYGGRACFFHPCSRSPYREEAGTSCSQLAMEAEEAQCQLLCNDLSAKPSATCQPCLEENMPDQCQHMSGTSCWHCSSLVVEQWKNCSLSHNDPLLSFQCILQGVVALCRHCICTLFCYWSPSGNHCRACLEEPELSTLFINHEHCQQGWTWSAVTSTCYKAFTHLKPWSYASEFCQSGGGHLAEPRYNLSLYGIIEAINIQVETGEYWIGGRNEEEDWDSFMWAGDSSIINSHDWASGFPLLLSGQVS